MHTYCQILIHNITINQFIVVVVVEYYSRYFEKVIAKGKIEKKKKNKNSRASSAVYKYAFP